MIKLFEFLTFEEERKIRKITNVNYPLKEQYMQKFNFIARGINKIVIYLLI